MSEKVISYLENVVLNHYLKLNLHQSRVYTLYKEGGITESIAFKELRSIYRSIKITKSVENYLSKLNVKNQTLSLQR